MPDTAILVWGVPFELQFIANMFCRLLVRRSPDQGIRVGRPACVFELSVIPDPRPNFRRQHQNSVHRDRQPHHPMNLKFLLCKTRMLPAAWLRLCRDCHHSASPRGPRLPLSIPTRLRMASATASSATAGWFSFDRKSRAAGPHKLSERAADQNTMMVVMER